MRYWPGELTNIAEIAFRIKGMFYDAERLHFHGNAKATG